MNDGLKAAAAAILAPLCISVLAGLSYGRGYEHGKAEGEAALQRARVSRAEERRREAEAFGRALSDSLAAFEAEAGRVNELAGQIQRERERHERDGKAWERRIAEVAGGSHVFGADFVCMLNAAAGVCDGSVPQGSASRGSDAAASPCAAFDQGLLEKFEGVSEADLLAWFIEYAGRCRTMESQLLGWRAFAGGEEEK